jgi:hypothetical protein
MNHSTYYKPNSAVPLASKKIMDWFDPKHSPIIDKISLSYKLVECYVFSFLQNEAIEIVVKGLLIHYVRSLEV